MIFGILKLPDFEEEIKEIPRFVISGMFHWVAKNVEGCSNSFSFKHFIYSQIWLNPLLVDDLPLWLKWQNSEKRHYDEEALCHHRIHDPLRRFIWLLSSHYMALYLEGTRFRFILIENYYYVIGLDPGLSFSFLHHWVLLIWCGDLNGLVMHTSWI